MDGTWINGCSTVERQDLHPIIEEEDKSLSKGFIFKFYSNIKLVMN